jgi:hypothetical protein
MKNKLIKNTNGAMQNKKDNFYSHSSGTNSGATSSGDEMDNVNLVTNRILEESQIFSSSLPATSNQELGKMIRQQNTTVSSSFKNNLNTLNERSLSDILGRRFITGSFNFTYSYSLCNFML